MDVPTSSSDCLFCSQLYHAYSCKSCTFFLLIFLLFLLIIVGLAALSVIFIIKPQKPIFSIESFRVVSYDLNTDSNSTLFVSSVVSMILHAQNPNKLGIKYSPSRLRLYLEGIPVGVIRIPAFNQPPHSNNVTVATRGLIHCLNVGQLLSGRSSHNKSIKNVAQMKLLSDIGVQLQLFQIIMPKIKVALDCSIDIDFRELRLVYAAAHIIKFPENYNETFPVAAKSLFNKCDIAIYI